MSTTGPSPFRRGLTDGLPFAITGIPFGLVYGIVAVEAGLDFLQAFSMSLLVFGGASQFAALAQLKDAAPALMAVAAGLMVNLRMAIYSASLAPHMGGGPLWKRALASYMLVDNAYVCAISDFEKRPNQSIGDKFSYYFAVAVPLCLSWMLASMAGIIGGRAIPSSYGIDFAVPLAFISLLAPMLRNLAQVTACLVSVASVVLLAAMPYNSELILGGLLGMLAGAEVERRRMR